MVQAYEHLSVAGIVSATPGGSTTVVVDAEAAKNVGLGAMRPVPPGPVAEDEGSPVIEWDLRPGRVDASLINEADWRRSWRAATRTPIGDDGPPLQRLRQALVGHLRTTRGIVVEANDILVVPSTSAGLRLLARAAELRGRLLAVEAPGYLEAAQTLDDVGVILTGAPVDSHGVIVDAIPAQARGLYVTPAHQFPLGARTTAPRRSELMDWAQRRDALVIEDDYDGEFRYDTPPLPALASVPSGRQHVAYLGTASKCLSPSLRLAWLVPPSRLANRVRSEVAERPEPASSISAEFLADFIESGALQRHLLRVRSAYARRRNALTTALSKMLPERAVSGDRAGLHLVLDLPPGLRAASVQRAARTMGVLVGTLDETPYTRPFV